MDAPDDNDISRQARAGTRPQSSVGVGQMLRAARLERDISIQDVARQLRLSAKQVNALETDEYDQLAGGTFLRGFVRNYAKLLQLDDAPLLRALERSVPPPPAQIIPPAIEGIPFPSDQRRARRNLIIGAGIIIALLLLAYEIYRSSEADVEKQPSVTAEPKVEADQSVLQLQLQPSAALSASGAAPGSLEAGEQKQDTPVLVGPAPTPPPAAEQWHTPSIAAPGPAVSFPPVVPAPMGSESAGLGSAIGDGSEYSRSEYVGANGIHLMFGGESWTEVKDGHGRLLLSRINPPGTEQILRGVPPYSLVIGNAVDVKLVYNSKPVDLAPYTNQYGGTARLELE